MRQRRGRLPDPVTVLVSTAEVRAAPSVPELRRRWDERGSYRPERLLTGSELLDRIWTERRTAA